MVRRRGLTPEDAALWDKVASALRPLHPPRTRLQGKLPQAQPGTVAGTAPETSSALSPNAPNGARGAHDGVSSAAPRRSSPRHGSGALRGVTVAAAAPLPEPLRMDHRLHGRMVRGKLQPEARLDLHGMTLVEGHAALSAFVLAASRRGLRLVLVITGKGRGGGGKRDDSAIPRRTGALRHEVPHWLRSAPLRGHVLNTHPAHRSHGGEGALYVYLRKPG